MSMILPEPIAAYFAADQGDDVARCFTENAIVIDEGESHKGRDAIRRWKAKTTTTFSYTTDPFAISAQGSQTVVTAHVVGNFPGSPVDLRYAFVIEGNQIARLEITL